MKFACVLQAIRCQLSKMIWLHFFSNCITNFNPNKSKPKEQTFLYIYVRNDREYMIAQPYLFPFGTAHISSFFGYNKFRSLNADLKIHLTPEAPG